MTDSRESSFEDQSIGAHCLIWNASKIAFGTQERSNGNGDCHYEHRCKDAHDSENCRYPANRGQRSPKGDSASCSWSSQMSKGARRNRVMSDVLVPDSGLRGAEFVLRIVPSYRQLPVCFHAISCPGRCPGFIGSRSPLRSPRSRRVTVPSPDHRITRLRGAFGARLEKGEGHIKMLCFHGRVLDCNRLKAGAGSHFFG